MRGEVMIARLRRAVLAVMLAGVPEAAAHDFPSDVKLNAFVKPAGNRLELLVRVPTAALVEVEFPLRGPGYLEMSRVEEALRSAAKLYLSDNITVYENDTPLSTPRVVALRISLPSDRSFVSFEGAYAHMRGPRLADGLDLVWNQQFLDVLLEYPIQSDRSDFAMLWRVDRFGRRVSTALRFLPPGGATRAFEFHGDPGLLRLDPRWHQAARRFVASGFWHILEGIDHLLFLLCLVIPFRRLRPLVIIVTAFTVAHSLSLIASASGFVPDALWFPPLIETLIAVTIVYMALENIVRAASSKDFGGISRRWIIAFAFGIIHGFGFSFALKETLQFAGTHLMASLLAFNVGVEFGQLLVLALLVPALQLLFRFVVAERAGIVVLSVLVGHTAWHWMADRWATLRSFDGPGLDLLTVMRAAIVVLSAVSIGWLIRLVTARRRAPQVASTSPEGHAS